MVQAWGRDDDGSSAAMTGLHFAWGVGAACSPLLAVALGLDGEDMDMVYTVIPSIAMVLMLAPLFAALPEKKSIAAGDSDGGFRVCV